MTENEYQKMYILLDEKSPNRSEHLVNYLQKKYGFIPTNSWMNVAGKSVYLKIGSTKYTLPKGTEIAFYRKTETGYECVGAGVIENNEGLLKFTPIYLFSSYDNAGLRPGEVVHTFILGFTVKTTPIIKYTGFGELTILEYVEF